MKKETLQTQGKTCPHYRSQVGKKLLRRKVSSVDEIHPDLLKDLDISVLADTPPQCHIEGQ